MLRNRGDVIWYYGGPPSVTDSSAAITEFPLRAWLWGVNGYVHWLTVSPGEDPGSISTGAKLPSFTPASASALPNRFPASD